MTSERSPSVFPTFRAIPRGLLAVPRWVGRFVRRTWRPIVVVLAVLVAVHLVLNVIAGRRLEAELSRLRAEGAPLTLAEAAPPEVPDSQNAAVLYRKAFRGLDNSDDMKVVASFTKVPHESAAYRKPPPTFAELQAVVARHQADFTLLRQGSLRPACRFPVDWNAGAALTLPHMEGIRNAARFLAAKALVDARQGRAGDALDDLAVAVRMANHIAPEPTLIAQLVRVACLGIVYGVLPEVLAAAPPTPAESRPLYDLLGRTDLAGPWVHAMEGERCFSLWVFDNLRRQPRGAELADLVGMPDWRMALGERVRTWVARFAVIHLWRAARAVWGPFLRLDEVYCLRQWRENLQITALPYRQARNRIEKFELRRETRSPWYALVSRVVVAVFARATQARDEGIARIGLMQAALALREYQIEHRGYPASLAQLRAGGGWAIPDDPFSGNPFIYRRQGAGYLIYSIGPDLKDSGGLDQVSVAEIARRLPPSRQGRLPWWQIAYDIPLRMER
jgi:hypothetical protein